MSKALIIVDVQKDFLPGGALAAEEGDKIIEPVKLLAKEVDYVVVTRDWHPEDHVSFSDEPTYEDGSWPVHCVQGTEGADIHPDIVRLADAVVSKGTNKDEEQYSGFEGQVNGTDEMLLHWLQQRGVDHVFVVGLVTEFCVRATAIDASNEGFRTTVNTIATASLGDDSGRLARNEMADCGVRFSDRYPRGDRERTRQEALEEAILEIVDEAEDAESGNYHDMSAWLGTLVRYVKERAATTEDAFTIVLPDAYWAGVKEIHIPAEKTTISA